MLAKFLACLLPRKAAYATAGFLSDIKYYLNKKDRDAVNYNLQPILKDKKKISQTSRAIGRNFSYYLVDFFRFAKIDDNFIKDNVKIVGLDYLNKLVVERKGIIILTAHIGNYELGGAFVAYLGYDIHSLNLYAVALPHRDKRLNAFFNRQREIFNVKIIPTGSAIKRCIQVLNENQMLAFLGDRDFTSAKGQEVVVCGQRAMLPKGPAYFALKTGACILPSFFVRENTYSYRLIFEAPIYPSEGNVQKNLEDIVQEFADVLSKYVARYPDQWYMFQKYWIET